MMTIEDAQTATRLAEERQQMARAKWNAIVHDPSLDPKEWGTSMTNKELVDEKLAWAIEEFRKRKLDEIDAELRALGVEPPRMPEGETDD